MAIVYRHRRLDTFEVFYVGIGAKEGRAYNKKDRGNYWKNIVNKYSYTVEIIADNLSWEEACELEILLISEYGRKDLRTGKLVNLTNGGEGVNGVIRSEETLLKRSKTVYQYTLDGVFIKEFKRAKVAEKELGINKACIVECCLKRQNHAGGYLWSYQNKKPNIPNKVVIQNRPVVQYSLEGVFIREWERASTAGKALFINGSGISACCKGKGNHAGGYIWTYRGEIPTIPTKIVLFNIPVIQYSLKGDIVKEWVSAPEASKELGIDSGNIIKCCKEKVKTAGGFIWKYKQ